MVPVGSSTARTEPKQMGATRKGASAGIAFITLWSLSTNKTSMGKRIKRV